MCLINAPYDHHVCAARTYDGSKFRWLRVSAVFLNVPHVLATEHLSAATARQLLHRQAALQVEAERVITDLDAFAVLSRVGQVRQVGSSGTGLITWRDLDLHVIAPDLSADRAWDVLKVFAMHPLVHTVRFLNQTRSRSLGGNLRNSRYFFQVEYGTNTAEEWKIDIAFWLAEDGREDDLAYQAHLVHHLDTERRLAIL